MNKRTEKTNVAVAPEPGHFHDQGEGRISMADINRLASGKLIYHTEHSCFSWSWTGRFLLSADSRRRFESAKRTGIVRLPASASQEKYLHELVSLLFRGRSCFVTVSAHKTRPEVFLYSPGRFEVSKKGASEIQTLFGRDVDDSPHARFGARVQRGRSIANARRLLGIGRANLVVLRPTPAQQERYKELQQELLKHFEEEKKPYKPSPLPASDRRRRPA
ncbi:MAG: hypothetical protein LAP61_22990 [Acidobacteriia bacterium]|nr:hypothetical protein [Terriglobia bacterium]